MYAPYQLPKPKNWQDLETLCLAIWKAEWKTKSLKTYGRPGQHQDGVDIFGRYEDGLEIGAIQCKCKEEEKILTESVIEREIENAKCFKPAIRHYVIATTFDSDVTLDSFVAEMSIKNMKEGSFSIDLFGWQDIERLIEYHTEVRDWYLNLTNRKNQTCEVLVEEPSDMILVPEYRRTHYVSKEFENTALTNNSVMDLIGVNKLSTLIQSYQNQSVAAKPKFVIGKMYHTRCLIKLSLRNTSDVTMKDVRVVVHSTPGSKFFLERKELDSVLRSVSLIDKMTVEEDHVSYYNMADYHPKDIHYLREFYIEPPLDVDEIELHVHITALDFVDDKVFILQVKPLYHYQNCYIDEKIGTPDSIEPYVEEFT